MRSVVRGVAGMPYPAGRSGWAAEDAATAGIAGRSRRGTLGLVPAVVGPLLAVSVLGALALHLLAGLVARLPATDALGALSVMVGMAVVLVTLLPFALLSVRRAQRAWAAMQESFRG